MDKGLGSGDVEVKTPERDPGGDRKPAAGCVRLPFKENGDP